MPEHDMSDEAVADLKQAFNLFDKDRDGTISKEELVKMLTALGQDVDEDEAGDMIAEVDKAGNGGIEFNEFLFMMAKRHPDEATNDVNEAFAVFDQDKDGYITSAELKLVLENLGEKLNDREVAQLMKDADADGDGRISLDDFKSLINK